MLLQQEFLQKAIDDYIINYSIEAGLMEKTIRNKKEILNRVFKFLDGKPYNFDNVKSFISFMYQNGWTTPNSRRDLVTVLRAFTNFLYKRKYISENFAQDLVRPKVPRKEFDYVDPETVEKIIIAGTEPGKEDNSRNKTIKTEMRQALRFILRTGLRINELISLKGSDLNLYDNPPTFWVLSKGGNRELLPLPKDMLNELEKRFKNERVFCVTEKTCNTVLERGVKILGIPVHLTNHSLRHIFASNLVKNGVPIQMVSRLMRHSSVEITDKTYTHLNVNDLFLIINSKQKIIIEGLSSSQILDNVEYAVKTSGIQNAPRFKVNIERNKIANEMVIKINT